MPCMHVDVHRYTRTFLEKVMCRDSFYLTLSPADVNRSSSDIPDTTATPPLVFILFISSPFSLTPLASYPSQSSHCHIVLNNVKGLPKVHKIQSHTILSRSKLISTNCLSEDIRKYNTTLLLLKLRLLYTAVNKILVCDQN